MRALLVKIICAVDCRGQSRHVRGRGAIIIPLVGGGGGKGYTKAQTKYASRVLTVVAVCNIISFSASGEPPQFLSLTFSLFIEITAALYCTHQSGVHCCTTLQSVHVQITTEDKAQNVKSPQHTTPQPPQPNPTHPHTIIVCKVVI